MDVTTENFGWVLPKALIKLIYINPEGQQPHDDSGESRTWFDKCAKLDTADTSSAAAPLTLSLEFHIMAQTSEWPGPKSAQQAATIAMTTAQQAATIAELQVEHGVEGLQGGWSREQLRRGEEMPGDIVLPYRIILMLVTSAAEMDNLKRHSSYVKEQISRIGNPSEHVAVFPIMEEHSPGEMRCSKIINNGNVPKVYYKNYVYNAGVTTNLNSFPYVGLYCVAAHFDPQNTHPTRGHDHIILGEPSISKDYG